MPASALAVDRFGTGSADSPAVSPFGSVHRLRAVLFDVDGTLYDQRRMRRLMLAELLLLPLRRPSGALRTWRALAAYRKAQERLREERTATGNAQIVDASQATGIPRAELGRIVDEWMMRRPLKYMRACRAGGLVELLEFLRGAGVELGVVSDYPASNKLEALGVAEYFSVVVSATDPGVGVFKPNPRGFLAACERWQVDPGEVLVVGDRAEVDAAGARAAGMYAVVIGSATPAHDVIVLPSIERLHRVLANDDYVR